MKRGRSSNPELAGQGKNTGAEVNGPVSGFHFVDQAKPLKAFDQPDDFPDAISLDSAVNLPMRIANSENLKPGAGSEGVGFFCHEGKDFLIYGKRFYAFDDLRLHGLIPLSESSSFGYLAKYLRKMVQA